LAALMSYSNHELGLAAGFSSGRLDSTGIAPRPQRLIFSDESPVGPSSTTPTWPIDHVSCGVGRSCAIVSDAWSNSATQEQGHVPTQAHTPSDHPSPSDHSVPIFLHFHQAPFSREQASRAAGASPAKVYHFPKKTEAERQSQQTVLCGLPRRGSATPQANQHELATAARCGSAERTRHSQCSQGAAPGGIRSSQPNLRLSTSGLPVKHRFLDSRCSPSRHHSSAYATPRLAWCPQLPTRQPSGAIVLNALTERPVKIVPGPPTQPGQLRDVGNPPVAVLVSLAIEDLRGHVHDPSSGSLAGNLLIQLTH